MENSRNKKICAILTLVGTMSVMESASNQVAAVKLDTFEQPDVTEEELVQLDQQESGQGQQANQKRPKDAAAVQTKDDAEDVVEQLSQEVMRKSEESPAEGDFVKREPKPEAEKAKEPEASKEKEPSEADIVSDSTTSMATIGEIVRKANEEQKQAQAEIDKANAEAAKKKAEEDRKRKE